MDLCVGGREEGSKPLGFALLVMALGQKGDFRKKCCMHKLIIDLFLKKF